MDDTSVVHQSITYSSRVDGTKPLHAELFFRADGRRKPLVAVMHGFRGNRNNVTADCAALAGAGLFCVAPDMRGQGQSAGRPDCGGVEICDIVDALAAACREHPHELDPARICAVGYSGGGGNLVPQ